MAATSRTYTVVEGVNDTIPWRSACGATADTVYEAVLTPGDYTGEELASEVKEAMRASAEHVNGASLMPPRLFTHIKAWWRARPLVLFAGQAPAPRAEYAGGGCLGHFQVENLTDPGFCLEWWRSDHHAGTLLGLADANGHTNGSQSGTACRVVWNGVVC